MESGIYCILNIMEDKRYVGQSQNIIERWARHKSALKNNKHENAYLQNAWNKYGEDAFYFYILESCSVEELNEKEISWISYYDTLTNGYNLCSGGNGIRGYKHTPEEIEKMIQIQKPKSVLQIDSNLNIIQRFPSASQASKAGFGLKRCIQAVCERKNHQKTSRGFIWVYEEDYENGSIDWDYYLNRNIAIPMPILQYNYLGQMVKRWDSIYQIKKELGYSMTSIIYIAKQKRKNENAYGYYWKYDNGIPLTIDVSYYEQYTLEGVLLCTFRSIKEFAIENNLSESSISKCISGKMESNKGYKYKRVTKTYILN